MEVELDNRKIGQRLIEAGILTEEQCAHVLDIQSDYIDSHTRFGTIATYERYCTFEQVESIGGYLGTFLVTEGIVSEEQKDEICRSQIKLRKGGMASPTFGVMAVMRNYCTKEEIETAINNLGW